MIKHLPVPQLSFQLESVKTYSNVNEPYIFEEKPNQYTFLFTTYGLGNIYINEEKVKISPGKLLVCLPGEDIRSLYCDSNSITIYELRLYAFYIKDGYPSLYKGNLFSGQTEIMIQQLSQMITVLEQLYNLPVPESEMDQLLRQYYFQDLLMLICKQQEQSNHFEESAQALAFTLDYMHRHYDEKITIKRLSSLANMTTWQYSALFQSITGKRPLNYLTEVRIERAKQILRTGNEHPLREIALRVGYQDEYYFNRRFRQVTGIPPKIYARSESYTMKYQEGKRRYKDYLGNETEFSIGLKRILFLGETLGDLLALGIQPVGSYTESFMDKIWSRQAPYKEQVSQITGVGLPLDCNKIKALNPDLIIMANPDRQQYEELSKYSPTLVFDTFAPLTSRLKTLADIFGKWDVVYKRLDEYDAEAKLMWESLSEEGVGAETATTIMYFPDTKQLYLVGITGLSQILYQKDGFKPTPAVDQLIKRRLGYKRIQEKDIMNYVGDRLFLIHPDSYEDKRQTEMLLKQKPWSELEPVKNKKVHIIDVNRGWSWDYLTNQQLIRELPDIIKHR